MNQELQKIVGQALRLPSLGETRQPERLAYKGIPQE